MSETTPTHPYPVLFIHGLWIHSSAWQPWQELFQGQGYATSAPGWPGDSDTVQGTRDNPDAPQRRRHPGHLRALCDVDRRRWT